MPCIWHFLHIKIKISLCLNFGKLNLIHAVIIITFRFCECHDAMNTGFLDSTCINT